MAKVNVSLPNELLSQVDEIARDLDRSRSGLVQEATAHYVAHLREEQAERERKESIGGAIKEMRRLAQELPPGIDGTTLIRADRDGDHGHNHE